MTHPKILLVEDDPNLGNILQEYLTLKGYTTTLCRNGQEGFQAYLSKPFDMCILDVMMPIMDGFTLATKIREKDKQTPIVFLTAKALKEDKIEGFKLGGDDYITKPFSMDELQLRIDAILRRTMQQEQVVQKEVEQFEIGSFDFNIVQQTLASNGTSIKLTTKESSLLRMLCQHKNEVLERGKALTEIWGEDNYFTARSMDVFITKLRKYLKKDPAVSIMNVHGKGYKLVDAL